MYTGEAYETDNFENDVRAYYPKYSNEEDKGVQNYLKKYAEQALMENKDCQGDVFLDSFDDERRENIVARGKELVAGLASLTADTNGGVTSTQGTGLLVSCALASRYKAYGKDSIENYLRTKGLGVIHGGKHSLRYTPVFDLSRKEVKLIVDLTRDALLNGPTQSDS